MTYQLSDLFNLNYTSLVRVYPLLDSMSSEYFYAQIMKAYYQNNTEKLKKIKEKIKDPFLKIFCDFRAEMVKGTLSTNKIMKYFSTNTPEIWIGEVLFCKGLSLYRLGDYQKSLTYFYESYEKFSSQKNHKKALLAYSNAITMKGNLDIRHRLMQDYHDVIKIASNIKAYDTLANAYMNLSDEFYKMGAVSVALDYIEKSLALLNGQKRTYQFYESLLMKIEILFCLGYTKEASTLLKEVEVTGTDSLLAAVNVIKFRHQNAKLNLKYSDKLTPPWRIKITKYHFIKPLGDTSNELLNELSFGVRHRDELLNKLYEGVDIGDAYNRLTTLISRINKKNTGLIEYHDKSFSLSWNDHLRSQYA